MGPNELPKREVRSICSILLSPTKAVTFMWKGSQQQLGSNDCGLFALANAKTLVLGQDPCSVSYIQCEMRKHFSTSLKNKFIEPFPSTTLARRPGKEVKL